jgi:UDP-N-acetylmuramate dehydrogenase
MEYLYSVPGNVGGAICMNAGRGEAFNKSISDHLVSMEIFDGERVRTITKEEGFFSYRTSVFQKMKNWIVLSVIFELPEQERDVGKQLIKERLAVVKENHDLGYPSAGTLFKRYFRPLPEIIGHRIGNAQFSVKTPGWVINLGGATFNDVAALIKYAKDCHKRHKIRVPEMEVVIAPQSRWDRLLARYK